MAIERKWESISPRLFTSDGTQFGVVTIGNTSDFKTKQVIYLKADTLPSVSLMVKRVISDTQMIVGPVNPNVSPTDYTNISQYTVALNASIGAFEQPKNNIPRDDHYSAVYQPDPIVADRTINVDENGHFYNNDNPVPTSNVGSAADKDWDDLILTRDSITQDVVQAVYKKNNVTVRTLDLLYDANENLVEVKKS